MCLSRNNGQCLNVCFVCQEAGSQAQLPTHRMKGSCLKGRGKIDLDGKNSLEHRQKIDLDDKVGLEGRQEVDLDNRIGLECC